MSDDKNWQNEPTIIKPTPGGRRGRNKHLENEKTSLFTILKTHERPVLHDFQIKGMPLIVSAARPLLNLLDRIKSLQDVENIQQLRNSLVEEMRSYERKIASAGIDVDHARIAHYILCATVDDVILATQWGASSGWGTESIVSTFHRDVQGGDRVFDLLDDQLKDPTKNQDVLFLIYYCLSLGFRGRLRVSSRGALELAHIRDNLYRTLQLTLTDFERELSPNWRGLNARNAKSGFQYLLASFLGFLVLVSLIGYIFILNLINTRSDEIIVALGALPPSGNPSIFVEQPVKAPIEQVDVIKNFLIFLQPEIQRGVLTTTRVGNEVLVRFRNTGTFEPGKAEIGTDFQQLLIRVAKSVAEARFDVLITGHTDNKPIRTVRFPSNTHLSDARAEAVANLVTRYVAPEKVRYEGRGEAEPIDTNDTAEGREANRRIEMLVRFTPQTDPNVIIQGVGAAK